MPFPIGIVAVDAQRGKKRAEAGDETAPETDPVSVVQFWHTLHHANTTSLRLIPAPPM